MATTRLLAYQSLFSLVQQVSFAATSQHDALDAHCDAMSAGDSVSAIVKSRRARTTLLQIATDLGIYGDARLRNALSEDEQRIANYISSILESESERAAVLQLTGDSAQYFLDVVQMVRVLVVCQSADADIIALAVSGNYTRGATKKTRTRRKWCVRCTRPRTPNTHNTRPFQPNQESPHLHPLRISTYRPPRAFLTAFTSCEHGSPAYTPQDAPLWLAFLPHTTTPIRCLLPLQADRMLLLGHDEGLSVLDMYPQDWNDSGGLDLKGPEEAIVRTIWEGECVFQMSILELDDVGGVVLMLVDLEPESPLKDSKYQRTLRMYNLRSLISLAKWAVANKVSSIPFNQLQQLTRLQGAHPLNLRTFAPQQTPTKKRRPTSSIARALKSLVSDSGSSSQTESSAYIPPLTLHSSIAGSSSSRSSAPSVRPPPQTNSDESNWEMVDDLPLRWARDFIPLASSGSRLENVNVLSFALWTRDEGARTGSQGQFLAVATKNNIFLYETPPNERAFRILLLLQEFHNPLQPKAICFFQQTVQELARSPTDVHSRHRRTSSSNGTQLSIFVVFEKKAGWIRLADSASGKIELFDTTADPTTNLSSYKWLLPVRCELPVPSPSVYVFTRGAMTQILPCPLPIHSAGPTRPLAVLRWRSTPVHVAPRVGGEAGEEVLQLTALGEGSVEVLEVPLAALGGAQPAAGGSGSGYESGNVYGNGNGKGKARAGMDELGVVRAKDDAGGETGFLCVGGYWDDPHQAAAYLQHSASISSDATAESVDAENIAERLRRAQGVYGWCRKGLAGLAGILGWRGV
ncbi:hypothetical protein MSAN_01486200 [Mycena sanguinolenta]|uniref:CNH domain-containing protein n=1 Tax=Mycena sanguinolenta TaxID=230812 RepID=A0A8H6YC92_9AGAR|nr:hypothetical protein MSAN_01486200 [Mycena sanguinolenta]